MLELKDTDSSEPEFAVFSRSEPYVIEDDVLDFTNGDAMLLVPDIPASIITVEKPESLIANKIQCGTSIAGVTGTYTADATATATDIASGKTAYIQGQCVIGTGRIGGQGYSYLTITGPNLQLSVTSPQWDGVLEYSLMIVRELGGLIHPHAADVCHQVIMRSQIYSDWSGMFRLTA